MLALKYLITGVGQMGWWCCALLASEGFGV